MERKSYILLFLAIITLYLYLPVFSFDFVFLDDDIHVFENPYINPPTVDNTFEFWKKPYEKLYIPLIYTAWSITAHFSDRDSKGILDPSFFHGINLLLHILNVFLIFYILKMILLLLSDYNKSTSNLSSVTISSYEDKVTIGAGFGAMLFAIHPLQVQSVAWVSGLKDLLCGFFSFLAILQYLTHYRCIDLSTKKINYKIDSSKRNRYREPKKNKTLTTEIKYSHLILATCFFILALLSKPIAVIVPVLLLGLNYYLFKQLGKKDILILLSWLGLAIASIIVTKLAQPDTVMKFIPPIWARFFIAGDAIAFYFYKLTIPLSFTINYGRSAKFVLEHSWVYFIWIIPVCLLIFIRLLKDYKVYLLSYGIFLVGVLPVLGFIPFICQDYSTTNDRYVYISMLGVSLAFSWFILRKFSKKMIIFCFVFLIVLGMQSSVQTGYWKNTITLLEHALEINNKSTLSHYNLGVYYNKNGRTKKATFHYLETIKKDPNYGMAYNNLAVIFAQQGNFDKSLEYFFRTLRLMPDFAETIHGNIGLIFMNKANFKDAIKHYSEVLKIDSKNSSAKSFIKYASEQLKKKE